MCVCYIPVGHSIIYFGKNRLTRGSFTALNRSIKRGKIWSINLLHAIEKITKRWQPDVPTRSWCDLQLIIFPNHPTLRNSDFDFSLRWQANNNWETLNHHVVQRKIHKWSVPMFSKKKNEFIKRSYLNHAKHFSIPFLSSLQIH